MTAMEKLREMFMENARKRGFTHVEWRKVDGKGDFFAYLGGGAGERDKPLIEPIPAETQAIIWKAVKPAARKMGLI